MKNIYILVGFLILTLGAGFIYVNREYISADRTARSILNRGKLYLEQSNDDGLRKAVDELTKVAATWPDTLPGKEALYHLAEGYERLGMRDVALSKYRKLQDMPLSQELKDQVKFKIAKLQILRSYTEEGMNQLLSLLAHTRAPAMRSEIYAEIGKYHVRKGNTKDAQRNLQIALQENGENKDARIALARLFASAGKDAEAKAVYEDYLAFQEPLDKNRDKNNSAFRGDALENGMRALTNERYYDAIRYLTLVTEKFPASKDSETAWYGIGNAYFKLRQYPKAVHAFNKVVGNAHPDKDEAAYVKKGEAYYHNKQYKQAAGIFSYVIRNYPQGKYHRIAADWEEECRRALGEATDLTDEDDGIIDEEEDEGEIQAKKTNKKPAKPVAKKPVKKEPQIDDPGEPGLLPEPSLDEGAISP